MYKACKPHGSTGARGGGTSGVTYLRGLGVALDEGKAKGFFENSCNMRHGCESVSSAL
jgi:hypothetical protein